MPNQASDGRNAGLFYACVMACFSIAVLVYALQSSNYDEKKGYFSESNICNSKIEAFLNNKNAAQDKPDTAYKSEKDILDICLRMRAVLADEKAAVYAAKSYIFTIIATIFLAMIAIVAGLAVWWGKSAVDASNDMNEIAKEVS